MADSQYPKDNPSIGEISAGNGTESHIQRALVDFVQIHGIHGVAADLLFLAGAGDLTRAALLERIDNLDLSARDALKENILDAILFVIERVLADHQISPAEQAALRRMKHVLGVAEGTLHTYRVARVTQILDKEMRRLLADRAIDPAEALHQVELQEAFDLGYDDYLALTQETAQRLVDELIRDIVADGKVTREEREHLERQIRALDTAYAFTASQRARLHEAGYDARPT